MLCNKPNCRKGVSACSCNPRTKPTMQTIEPLAMATPKPVSTVRNRAPPHIFPSLTN